MLRDFPTEIRNHLTTPSDSTDMNQHTLNRHIIRSNDFLSVPTEGFFRHNYYSFYSNRDDHPYHLNTLKNDFNREKESKLSQAYRKLYVELSQDLLCILRELQKRIQNCSSIEELPQEYYATLRKRIVVTAVPRSKPLSYYYQNQTLFYSCLNEVLQNSSFNFENGIKYIERRQLTPASHLNKGLRINPGTTLETCCISREIQGRIVILVDDIYTRTINIDEDAIQALYEYGAELIVLYTVARTV